jgi:hypothetical protein
MNEVSQHIGATHFSWVGGTAPTAFSTIASTARFILIEFDHQRPVAIGNRGGPPNREHVHAVVRTPNAMIMAPIWLRSTSNATRTRILKRILITQNPLV